MKKNVSFSSATVAFYFNADFSDLLRISGSKRIIIITDENVYKKHRKKFSSFSTIVIAAGEEHKVQSTVDNVIEQLIQLGADRTTMLVGVGGGVVTDIAGFVAGIFMRGISFGFVPTTILAMVDAAIGGKNGIDVGVYKNMIGLIRQPAFILYDFTLLSSLPGKESVNGFAEIIKHACIKDQKMFNMLKQHSIKYFRNNPEAIAGLIRQNVNIKTKIVKQDEFETGDRKLLNLGHTFGHAIENLYQIPHGHAVSIGMGMACKISEIVCGFKQTGEVISLLKQYGLPPAFQFDKEATFKILQADKKKDGEYINFVLLKSIGKGVIHRMRFTELSALIEEHS